MAATFGARAKLSNHQTGLLKNLQSSTGKTRQIQQASPLATKGATEEAEKTVSITVEDTTVGLEEEATSEKMVDPNPQADAEASPQNDYDRLLEALKGLKAAIPLRKPVYGSTLQDMSDMTALIASKMYAPKVHSPIEGEVRKELRAAKGLLLNRYVFRILANLCISSHIPCRRTFTAAKSAPTISA